MQHVVRLLSVSVLSAALLTGCGEVEVIAPQLDAADRATCEKFLSRLPAELLGQSERAIDPVGATIRAWGDPAVVVTCGARMPPDFDDGSPCEIISGVGWYVPISQESIQKDLDVVTIEVRPIVRLQLPATYRSNPANVADTLALLSGAVTTSMTDIGHCDA